MINKEKIKLNEEIYYVPSYSGTTKVSIIEIINDDKVLVKPVSQNKKEFKPFTTPLVHVFNRAEDARIGKRAWESYMCKRNNKRR